MATRRWVALPVTKPPTESFSNTRLSPATVVRLLVAALFVGAGAFKLVGTASMVTLFAAVGVGQWLRYAVGLAELAGAVLLVVPPLAELGAMLLSGIMVGAVTTQLILSVPVQLFAIGTLVITASPVVPTVVLGVLVWIAWTCRRDAALRPSRDIYHLARRR